MSNLAPRGNDASTPAARTPGKPPRRGLAIGCGGTLGFTWTIAALAALRDTLHWDPAHADAMIGTSAGAELVTMLASGVTVDELVAVQLEQSDARADLVRHRDRRPGILPPLPRPLPGSPRLALRRDLPPLSRLSGLAPLGGGDPAWLDDLATSLVPNTSWFPHRSAWLVGMDYATGARVPFGAPGSPPATVSEALRASWAVPGWLPPVRINGRRYIDGGAASTASADLLAPLKLDEVIVLAPMTSRNLPPATGAARLERAALRNPMSAVLAKEVEVLRAAGTRVLLIDANDEDLEAMGPNMMDHRRRRETFVRALRTTKSTLAHELNEHAPVRSAVGAEHVTFQPATRGAEA